MMISERLENYFKQVSGKMIDFHLNKTDNNK